MINKECSIKLRLPFCIGLAKTNGKGKILKKGLFTWIESWEEFRCYINTIEDQLEELRDNEKFYKKKLNQLESEAKELLSEEEIKLIEKEKEYTHTILKTLKSIEKDTNEMWLTTIQKVGKKYKLEKIQKIENIIKKGF